MFSGFSNRIDVRTQRRMALSFGAAVLVYVALGSAVVIAATSDPPPPTEQEKEVDVTFFKALPPPPKPAVVLAPTPPKAAAPAPAPAPAAPVVAAKPKPKTPLAPKEIPTDKPKEAADPGPIAKAVTPDADPPSGPPGTGPTNGDPNATGTGDPNAKGSGNGPNTGDGQGTGSGPVVLPPGATPPELIGALVTEADYPRGARDARIEGVVKVKVAIQVDGTVTLVKFVQHDENFDAAVLAILKRVRYKPAVYNGQTIAVYKILVFPFEMD